LSDPLIGERTMGVSENGSWIAGRSKNRTTTRGNGWRKFLLCVR